MPKRILEGVVTSNAREKTVTVQVTRRVMHPRYKKYIKWGVVMADKKYQYIVQGIKHINYKNKDGKQVIGTKLYLIDNFVDVDDGNACDDVYCPQSVDCNGIEVGCSCNIFYNRFGGVSAVEYIS